MPLPGLTQVACLLFMAYIGHSFYTIYQLFYPPSCEEASRCIHNHLKGKPSIDILIYASPRKTIYRFDDQILLHKFLELDYHSPVVLKLNVSIPSPTLNNGSLFAHVYCVSSGTELRHSNVLAYESSGLTAYAEPQATAFQLIGDSKAEQKPKRSAKPTTHWRSRLIVSLMTQDVSFDRQQIPSEVFNRMRIKGKEYNPLLYIDQLSNRIKDLQLLEKTSTEMELKLTYQPISIGKLRLWLNLEQSIKSMHDLGFSEKDSDEIKGIFSDTNFYFLLLTLFVAALHLLFDFLAFKNDISYWRKRKTMVGLSSRVVAWRCISTFIIFFYLLDENTSLLVLIPSGIGAVIELWKVYKAFKVKIHRKGWKVSLQFGEKNVQELETQQFDNEAMKYLSWLLYPLCIGGAVYSLLYSPHKSWRSWCIQSLVNGVYAFGFLFMLPQLFVNYKLKSVAHLPWKAFMYKAFNTFIDDIFAFVITMPTAHRIACFRDDLVFIVYLYQRWLYPVDKKRLNEFGQTFDDEDKKKQ